MKCYDLIRAAKKRKVSSGTSNKIANEIKYKYITKQILIVMLKFLTRVCVLLKLKINGVISVMIPKQQK